MIAQPFKSTLLVAFGDTVNTLLAGLNFYHRFGQGDRYPYDQHRTPDDIYDSDRNNGLVCACVGTSPACLGAALAASLSSVAMCLPVFRKRASRASALELITWNLDMLV